MKRYEVTVADGYVEGSGLVEAGSLDTALQIFMCSGMSSSYIRKATIIECPWNRSHGCHSISQSYQNRLKERTKCLGIR